MSLHWTPQREAWLERAAEFAYMVAMVCVLVFLLYLAATHGEEQRCDRLAQDTARWQQVCAEVQR